MNKKLLFIFSIILFSISISVFAILPEPGGTPPKTGSSETFEISLKFKESNSETLSIGTDDTGQATLVWEVKYIKTSSTGKPTQGEAVCNASGGWSGEKSMSGEEKITLPKETTFYILSCHKKDKPDEGGLVTASIIVKRISLTANPSTVILDESTKLTYDITSIYGIGSSPTPTVTTLDPRLRLPGAIHDVFIPETSLPGSSNKIKTTPPQCYLNNDLITISSTGKGEISKNPTDDTTYTLKCTWQDSSGSHQSSASVLVKVAKVEFDIDPKEYYIETTPLPIPVLLGWQSRYFDKCTASSNPNVWSGDKSLSGIEEVKVNSPTSFTLECSGINGDSSRKKSLTQKIEAKSLSSFPVWIVAKPSQIFQGEEVIVTWGITGRGSFDSCSLSLEPLTPVLAYSNDTSCFAGGNQPGGNQQGEGKSFMWGGTTSSTTKATSNPADCFKEHIWIENPTQFKLSPRELAQLEKNPSYYKKSFSISTSGYHSIKIKPTQDTTVSIYCEKEPIEVGGGIEKEMAEIETGLPTKNYVDGEGNHYTEYWATLRDPDTGRPIGQTKITYKTDKNYANGQYLEGWSVSHNLGGSRDVVVRTTITPGKLVGGGSQSASITIKVLKGDELLVSLSANPTEIKKGEKTTLSYSSINASTSTPCVASSTDSVWNKTITPDSSGKTSGSDEITLNKVQTYDFSYTCYDKNNQPKTATASVKVTEECDPPNKIPHNICSNGKCISVSTCGKDECQKDSDCPSPPPPHCSNVDITASPQVIFLGRTTNLTWSSENCDNCEATCYEIKDNENVGAYPNCGEWNGNVDKTSGTKEIKPTSKGTFIYKITCSGTLENYPISDEAEVQVKVLPVPFWHEIIPVLPGFLRGLFR